MKSLNTPSKIKFLTTSALATALFAGSLFSGNAMGQAAQTVKEGAEKVGSVAKTVGTKTVDGAKTVGTKTEEGAKTVAKKTEEGTKAVAKKVEKTFNPVTDKDIADAKAKGMVWTNPNSKVYHVGGEYYGHTKEGKFMTKDEAEKAGYRAAKEPVVGKKKTETTDKK